MEVVRVGESYTAKEMAKRTGLSRQSLNELDKQAEEQGMRIKVKVLNRCFFRGDDWHKFLASR